ALAEYRGIDRRHSGRAGSLVDGLGQGARGATEEIATAAKDYQDGVRAHGEIGEAERSAAAGERDGPQGRRTLQEEDAAAGSSRSGAYSADADRQDQALAKGAGVDGRG